MCADSLGHLLALLPVSVVEVGRGAEEVRWRWEGYEEVGRGAEGFGWIMRRWEGQRKRWVGVRRR